MENTGKLWKSVTTGQKSSKSVKIRTLMDWKVDIKNLWVLFLERTLSRHLVISQSIFGVQSQTKTLYPFSGHPARNASVSSRYYDLQIPFWACFHLWGPFWYLRNECSRAVLRHEILDGDGFLTPDSVCDHWRCTNIVFETRNEPSFAEIGQKLTSVDQKVLSIMVSSFSDKDLFVSLFFS